MTAIVVDSSAIVAILRNEPEKDAFVDAILAASVRFISAVSLQELGMVVAGRSATTARARRLTRWWLRWISKSLRTMTALPASPGRHSCGSARGAIRHA